MHTRFLKQLYPTSRHPGYFSVVTCLRGADVPGSTIHFAVAYKPRAVMTQFFGVALTCKEKEKKQMNKWNLLNNDFNNFNLAMSYDKILDRKYYSYCH
jgi:hypothetical protein